MILLFLMFWRVFPLHAADGDRLVKVMMTDGSIAVVPESKAKPSSPAGSRSPPSHRSATTSVDENPYGNSLGSMWIDGLEKRRRKPKDQVIPAQPLNDDWLDFRSDSEKFKRLLDRIARSEPSSETVNQEIILAPPEIPLPGLIPEPILPPPVAQVAPVASQPIPPTDVVPANSSLDSQHSLQQQTVAQQQLALHYEQTIAHLDDIKSRMKGKYKNSHDIIDELLQAYMAALLTPENLSKPLVIFIVGPNGESKSAVILELISELGVVDSSSIQTLNDNTPFIEPEGMLRVASRNPKDERPGFLVIEELQKLLQRARVVRSNIDYTVPIAGGTTN